MSLFPFTPVPSTINSLQLWLDSSDSSTVVQSGGFVSRWIDKSGNRFDSVQGTGSLQPSYGVYTWQNKPVLYFDGVDDTMSIANNNKLNPLSGGFSIFCVIRWITTTGTPHKFSKGNSNAAALGYSWRNNSMGAFTSNGDTLSSTNGFPVTAFNADPYVVGWTFSGTSTSYYNNNVIFGTPDSYSGTINPSSALVIGKSASQAGVEMQAMEFMIYNREVTTDERLMLSRYLANKWGASI